MIAGEFVYKYTGDTSGFKKATKEVKKGNQEIRNGYKENEKSVFKFGTAVKVGLVAAVAVGIAKIKQFFGSSIDAASEAQETAQKLGNVYTEIGKKANQAAKELQGITNVSLTESKQMLAFSGNVLTGMGIGQEAALGYSKTIGQMAADLKSFNDDSRSTIEITKILTKAMLGERDALVGLGFKISEQDLISYAKSQGVVWKNLQQQEKAQLSLNLMMERTANAYGDVQKSQDTYAYATRRLENQQRELKEEFGKQFLPALTDLKNAFADSGESGGFLYNALIFIGKAFGKVVQFITAFIRGIEAVNAVSTSYKDTINDIVKVSNKYGVSSKRVGDLLGGQKLGLIDLQKELEKAKKGTSNYSVAAVKAALEVSKSAKSPTEAIDKFKEAVGKLTGSLKEGEKAGVKGFTAINRNASDTANAVDKVNKNTEKLQDTFSKLSFKEKLLEVHDGFQSVAASITDLISSIDNFYQASADRQSEQLERQRQDALEAAGVAEETEVEKAEKELKQAKEKGDKELIQEKKIALKRAKINEEFDKKQAELEYNANLRSWELQLAMAKIQMLTAPLNAFVSSLSAPWPLNMILAPLNASLALATATLQHAAIAEARPQKPKFAGGGIVPGNMTSGDQVDAKVNSGEMILNGSQQANLFDMINGGGKPIMIHNVIELEGRAVADFVTEASRENRLKISDKSVVRY